MGSLLDVETTRLTPEEQVAASIVVTLDIVLFLLPRQKPPHEYAILARIYDSTKDHCCTCLKLTGTLETYGHKEINLAIKRLNNKNNFCPLKDNMPKLQLQKLLIATMLSMGPSFHTRIAELERNYLSQSEEAESIKESDSPTEDVSSKVPLQSGDVLQLDMKVRRWFELRELPKNHDPADGLVGAFVNGWICTIGVKGTKRAYKISFEAPIAEEMWYSEDEVIRFRASYTVTATYAILNPTRTIYGTPNEEAGKFADTLRDDGEKNVVGNAEIIQAPLASPPPLPEAPLPPFSKAPLPTKQMSSDGVKAANTNVEAGHGDNTDGDVRDKM